MSSLNNVVLVGHLVRDPALKTLPSGGSVCEFGIALNRVWNDKATNEKKEEVTFVDVSAWGRLAETCAQFLAKGRQVALVGRLKQDRWETKEGQKRSKLTVIAESITFIGRREESTAAAPETEEEVSL